jgi:SAM-dependent methyltransferase
LYLRDQTQLGSKDISLLYFAPEEAIERRLRVLPRLRYVSADLSLSSIAMICTDITNIPFADETFDIVICNHVLEHVADDYKALQEIHRVLKPAGSAYMMHPVSLREHTDEDPTVSSKAERRRRFGQYDHVRRYGQDFIQRPPKVGFDIKIEEHFRTLSEDTRAKYVLGTTRIYICSKPG